MTRQMVRSACLFACLFALLECGKKIIIDQSIKDRKAIRKLEEKYKSASWEERGSAVRDIVMYLPSSEGKSLVEEKYRYSNPALIEQFLLQAAKDPHPAVRIEALKSLTLLSSQQVQKRIREMAVQEINGNVRWYALKALSAYKDPVNSDIFFAGLNSEDWLVREAAVTGLCMVETKDDNLKNKILTYIIMSINDSSESVRIAALQNVRINDGKIYDEISGYITGRNKKTSTALLKAALKALKGYKLDEAMKKDLIALFTHYDSEVRILALRVLKSDGGKTE